jgi:hypothetical protein
MNDKLITKAIECYTEKLEEENKTLKDIIRQIGEVFAYHGKNETDKDRLNNIINIIRYYEKTFKEEMEK